MQQIKINVERLLSKNNRQKEKEISSQSDDWPIHFIYFVSLAIKYFLF